MPVIFSDFLVSNEMSGYTENNSTTIFIVHELFLSYKLFKVYRNNMDHPVYRIVSKTYRLTMWILFKLSQID